ncbi:unnamed protein product [Effrenium voratum]|nr:unnamed protein product [Effrenium voratum]
MFPAVNIGRWVRLKRPFWPMILNDFLRLASRWRDLLSWKEMEPDAPLQRLGELEPCLFLVVFSFLDGASCARCGALFANARSMALEASKENAKFRLEGGGVLLSRWLSSNYAACQVFQQQLDLEIASQHFATIAGRYSLPEPRRMHWLIFFLIVWVDFGLPLDRFARTSLLVKLREIRTAKRCAVEV